jgi:predicted DNA-binding protein with PD1-like motif
MDNSSSSALSGLQAATLRLRPDEDLKRSLDEFVTSQNIKAACLITAVGSLRRAVVRYAGQEEATIIEGKFEIVSLTGTLGVAGSHLHIALSNSDGKTFGGHLKDGALIYTTAEIVLGILSDFSFERELDPTYGYKELTVKRLRRKL